MKISMEDYRYLPPDPLDPEAGKRIDMEAYRAAVSRSKPGCGHHFVMPNPISWADGYICQDCLEPVDAPKNQGK